LLGVVIPAAMTHLHCVMANVTAAVGIAKTPASAGSDRANGKAVGLDALSESHNLTFDATLSGLLIR